MATRQSSAEFRTRNKGKNEQTNLSSTVFDYEILKTIFELLCFRDVLSCSVVCRNWYEVSKIVRKQRVNKANILLYHLYAGEYTSDVVRLSNNFEQFLPETILSSDEGTPACHRLYRTSYEDIVSCEDILRRDLEPSLWNSVHNQYAEPCLIVCFGTPSLPLLSQVYGVGFSTGIYIFQRTRKVCPCLGVFGKGLVLTLPDNTACFENECRNTELFLPMISGLVLPKVRGFKVATFSMLPNAEKNLKVTAENCMQILNIQPEDNVKGILLFETKYVPHQTLLRAIHAYLKINPAVAFGGGLFGDVFTSEGPHTTMTGCGLVISGDENVRVGSTLLGDSREIDNNYAKSLKEFKDARIVGDNDFAFMFSCVGRGFGLHQEPHKESTLFRKEYPNVPLIGAFTGGEYFHPYISGQEKPPPPSPKKLPKLTFAYKTVFVYVSLSR